MSTEKGDQVNQLFTQWRTSGGDLPKELYDAVIPLARGVVCTTWQRYAKRTKSEVASIGGTRQGSSVINEQTLEEVAHNATVKCLFEKLHQFKGRNGAKFTTWAYRIIERAATDALRTETRLREEQPKDYVLAKDVEPHADDFAPGKKHIGDNLDSGGDSIGKPHVDQEPLATPNDIPEIAQPALNEHQQKLWKAILDGRSTTEIAKAEGVEPRTVQRWIEALLSKLAPGHAPSVKSVMAAARNRRKYRKDRAEERQFFVTACVEIKRDEFFAPLTVQVSAEKFNRDEINARGISFLPPSYKNEWSSVGKTLDAHTGLEIHIVPNRCIHNLTPKTCAICKGWKLYRNAKFDSDVEETVPAEWMMRLTDFWRLGTFYSNSTETRRLA